MENIDVYKVRKVLEEVPKELLREALEDTEYGRWHLATRQLSSYLAGQYFGFHKEIHNAAKYFEACAEAMDDPTLEELGQEFFVKGLLKLQEVGPEEFPDEIQSFDDIIDLVMEKYPEIRKEMFENGFFIQPQLMLLKTEDN